MSLKAVALLPSLVNGVLRREHAIRQREKEFEKKREEERAAA